MTYDLESQVLRAPLALQADIVAVVPSAQVKNGKVEFEKDQLPFSLFDTKEEFFATVHKRHLTKDVVIRAFDGSPYYHSSTTGVAQLGTTPVHDYLVPNAVVYFHFLELLENLSQAESVSFEFVDKFSRTAGRVTFAAPVDKKKVVLSFPVTGLPHIDPIDYSRAFAEFEENLRSEKNVLPGLTKSALIGKLCALGSTVGVPEFFRHLEAILGEAKLNFGVYIHELSLESIQKDYRNFRKEYFKEQNEIISKLTSQLIALPVSLAGSAFAVYKLNEYPAAIYVILVGIVFYGLYSSHVAKLFWEDAKNLERVSQDDYEYIRSNEFFAKHDNELKEFKRAYEWVERRLRKIKGSIHMYYYGTWMSGFGIIGLGIDLRHHLQPMAYVVLALLLGCIVIGTAQYTLFSEGMDTEEE